MPRHAQFPSVLLLLWLISLPLPAQACNIPVFRYALELWPAEPYELLVFHSNDLTATQANLISSLQATNNAGNPLANLRVVSTDLNSPVTPSPETDRTQRIWNSQTNTSLPWLVLLAPHDPDSLPVWTGPLNATNVGMISESPTRRLITERLLKGESAVWVLLEDGNATEDEQLARDLAKHLQKAQTELKLPPPAPDDPTLHANIPLQIAFSIVRVSRTDPAEHVFVRTMLNGEPGLESGAVAFPIFGQGRTLAAFKSQDLTQRIVHEASAFMAGPCSCEVKELNPGKDLLFAANWSSIFEDASVTQPPSPSTSSPQSPVTRHILLTAAALSTLIALAVLALLRRARKSTNA